MLPDRLVPPLVGGGLWAVRDVPPLLRVEGILDVRPTCRAFRVAELVEVFWMRRELREPVIRANVLLVFGECFGLPFLQNRCFKPCFRGLGRDCCSCCLSSARERMRGTVFERTNSFRGLPPRRLVGFDSELHFLHRGRYASPVALYRGDLWRYHVAPLGILVGPVQRGIRRREVVPRRADVRPVLGHVKDGVRKFSGHKIEENPLHPGDVLRSVVWARHFV